MESNKLDVFWQKQTIQCLEHGGVPTEEFVEAFKEMLSGARINMDPKRQCLLQTILSLQEQLKESQATLVLEQEKSKFATKEADLAKVALLCRICLTNEIGVTMVPCGHLLCHPCSSAVSCCPICGVQLSTVMKIYRP
uniref:E3 ubiquitin-protein ligase MYLIP-B-like n=1 Tax=Erigeron canadensis TaxID=72917 RepID=UPI001CB9B26F|nr:E3 ubiquitin-protein ligase MYLIP-B-like [Erigeron canadensis]